MFEKLRLEPIVLVASILVGIIIFSSVVFSLSNFVTIPSSGKISSGLISPLRIQGSKILDDQNNTVYLRGVNCGGMADAQGGMWEGTYFYSYSQMMSNIGKVDGELAEIQIWGCNCIRVMNNARFWIYNDSGEINCVKQLLAEAMKYGIYVVFSTWCVQDAAHGASQDPLPYPPYQTSTNASQVIPSEAAYEAYELNIAGNLSSYPNFIQEFWNEPQGSDTNHWFTVMQTCVNMIRGAGYNNILMLSQGYGIGTPLVNPTSGTPGVDNPGATFAWVNYYNFTGSNLIYDEHYYDVGEWNGFQYPDNTGGNLGGGGLNYTQIMQGMADCWVNYTIYTLQKPVFIGEFGADLGLTGQSLTDELNNLNNIMLVMNSLGISYADWIFQTNSQYTLLNSYAPSWTPSAGGSIFKANV
jgi:hypothetical protein